MKPRIREVIVVEGRYDRNTLLQAVDASVVEVGGFALFNDREKMAYLRALAVPWILWTAVTILIERRADCAAPRAAGLLTGLILIPALFYTYTGICGKSVDVVNVLIFQAAVLAAWLVSRGLQRRGSLSAPLWQVLGILVQLGAAAVFAVWTVNPPELPLFVDPTNGTRGV